MHKASVYSAIIEEIFRSKYRRNIRQIEFTRDEITQVAKKLSVSIPKNLGDLVYSARYRSGMPKSIADTAGKGRAWIIRPAGRSRYRFELVVELDLRPNSALSETKIPDGTPGIVAKYALSDEQALLARLRYNRLIDVFLGITCYSLQNHLRTSVPSLGQLETDEIYVGLDKRGMQYVVPVQAKGHRDSLNMVQIEQDVALCRHRFRNLVCRPVGAQFMTDDVIVLYEFESSKGDIRIGAERHYRLVPPEEVTDDDLALYSKRSAE